MLRPAISAPCVIALDVGGSSVKSAIVARGGQVVAGPATAPIDSRGSAGSILDALASRIRSHASQISAGYLLGVGLGFPGPFDYAAGICKIRGLDKYESLFGLNVGEALCERVDLGGRPIRFRNDAEAAIVGEARYGAGQAYRRLIGVTLGTGCGSAFIAGGQPVAEGEGVPANGWLYPLSFRGIRADDCFSRRGIESRLQAARLRSCDLQAAAANARAGDTSSQQVFRAFGADLGEFLAPFVAAFRAEAMLVLGGIAGAFDLFGPPLREALVIPVLPGVYGVQAALIGAAELIFDRYSNEQK